MIKRLTTAERLKYWLRACSSIVSKISPGNVTVSGIDLSMGCFPYFPSFPWECKEIFAPHNFPCDISPMKRTGSKSGRHGAGKNSVDIACTIPADVDAELRKLAAASELTRGGYARDVIIQAVANGYLRKITRTTAKHSKIVQYPLDHPENPTARAADDAAG